VCEFLLKLASLDLLLLIFETQYLNPSFVYFFATN
ncbi:hypothetical protein NT04LS_2669a, partial [Listeria seeligeri FSL S4-171]